MKKVNDLSREYPGIQFILVIIIIGLLLFILLERCSADEQQPEIQTTPFNRTDYFEGNQIILTFPNEAYPPINNFTSQDRTPIEITDGLEIVERIELTFPPSVSTGISKPFCPGLPSNLEDSSGFSIALANITDGRSVEEVLAALENAPGFENIISEPNLLIGSPDYPTGSSTSTWETVAVTTREDYESQWAFELIDRGTPDPEEDGAGVRVVIFDTVPTFMESSAIEPSPAEVVTEEDPYEVTWVDPDAPMNLQVGYGPVLSTQTATASDAEDVIEPTSSSNRDLGHHGLFAAQMVHAISPASEIELIRVLDNQVNGNMYTLIFSLYDALLSSQNGRPTNEPTVVNMSLGIRIPPPEADFDLPTSGIEALRTVVQLAYCKGMVIVAASGNNSIFNYPPELAHLPADWSSVISVAASNMANQRSCFSNQGDIAAPGGDGRMPDDPIPSDPQPLGCHPRLNMCPSMHGKCPFAIIGPIKPPTPGSSETGLIYWDGSSFASPLVAGLAARILSKNPILSPDEVRHIIECGATEATFPDGIEGQPDRHIGEGVINVERTLNECMSPSS